MRKFPVPHSKVITGLEWQGDRIPYPDPFLKGDTFPMTWAADDNIVTSSGDPCWSTEDDGLDVERFIGGPTDYKIQRLHNMWDYEGWGGWGPKPCGMISVDGVLYLAIQNTQGYRHPAHGGRCQHGSDATILLSIDYGANWRPRCFKELGAPMFPGYKFGGPSFVNYGKDNANAVDEFVYAVSGDQWDNGSDLRLGRVPRDRIVHACSWEWVSGFDKKGSPRWSSALDESEPVLTDDRHISLPEMVYLAGIKRYLLLTWHLKVDFSPEGSDLMIYEAPKPWGPFALVHYEEYFEGKEATPYCPRIPLKWMEADGVTGWLQHSGSWHPNSPYYRSNVRKFRLTVR